MFQHSRWVKQNLLILEAIGDGSVLQKLAIVIAGVPQIFLLRGKALLLCRRPCWRMADIMGGWAMDVVNNTFKEKSQLRGPSISNFEALHSTKAFRKPLLI